MAMGESLEIKNYIVLRGLTTTERDAFGSSIKDVSGAVVIFNKTTAKLEFYDDTSWKAVTSA